MNLLKGEFMVKDPDEYELIPVSPIRRLEKRLDRVESSSNVDSSDIFKEVIDIVRMNQQLVNELARANDALRIELSKLPGKLDELIVNLKEIISFIKSSGEEESVGITQEAMKPVVDKLDEMVKTNKTLSEKNDSMLGLLDEISKKIKRPPTRPLKLLPRRVEPLIRIKPINV